MYVIGQNVNIVGIINFCTMLHYQKLSRDVSCFLYILCKKRYFRSSKHNLNVQLTSKKYPSLKRGQYAILNDSDLKVFENIIQGRVLKNSSELDRYNTDWLQIYKGAGQVVLRPKTTEEVSEILKYCNKRKIAVVPQGGNTGLVGGSVPVFDEVILSTELMNKIISVDDLTGVLVCQAGCVLATLEDHVSAYNLTMPYDLGAKGSCHIGGNIATNAGGLRLLKHGSLHGSVLGLEVVLANGDVLDCLSTLRKDNTGYDLKHLFIGSEGTLGVVTGVSILCPQKPNSVNVAFLGCDNFSSVLDILVESKRKLAEILSAFEVFDSESMLALNHILNISSPIGDHRFYVLIETYGSDDNHNHEKLNRFLSTAMETGLVHNGLLATELTKIKNLWSLRERIAEALNHDGYDVSLPLPNFYDLVEAMRDKVGSDIRVIGYGHAGDGNIHLNVTSSDFRQNAMDTVKPYIYDWISSFHGSISAEHGLGFQKKELIYHSKTKTTVSLMKRIKSLMDPNGILNPYKTLPSQ